MKKRTVLIVVAVIFMLAALVPVGGAIAGFLPQPQAMSSAPKGPGPAPLAQGEPPIPDLSTLLNYPYEVSIEELEIGDPERDIVLETLLTTEACTDLLTEMAGKGFVFDLIVEPEVMVITIMGESGPPTLVQAMTVSTTADELSGALTCMLGDDGYGLFQAHHTNLDPHLAAVPDPPIIVNDMPYFYITTLRWIEDRIIRWHYWWYDSHHHPNWYYSHYYWYWKYYMWYLGPIVDPPVWYWWAYGWYYWRYWYYWSTWFPYSLGL